MYVSTIVKSIDDDYTLIAQQQFRDHCFKMLIFNTFSNKKKLKKYHIYVNVFVKTQNCIIKIKLRNAFRVKSTKNAISFLKCH